MSAAPGLRPTSRRLPPPLALTLEHHPLGQPGTTHTFWPRVSAHSRHRLLGGCLLLLLQDWLFPACSPKWRDLGGCPLPAPRLLLVPPNSLTRGCPECLLDVGVCDPGAAGGTVLPGSS